ncbi:hypothetical protein KI387_012374, partial [Taxus chinensis]
AGTTYLPKFPSTKSLNVEKFEDGKTRNIWAGMKKLVTAPHVAGSKRPASRNRYNRPVLYVAFVFGLFVFFIVLLYRAFSPHVGRTDCHSWFPKVNAKCTAENPQQPYAISLRVKRSETEENHSEFQENFSKEASEKVANRPSVLKVTNSDDLYGDMNIYINVSDFRR